MSQPDGSWLRNVKATARQIRGLTVRDNTLVYALDSTVTYESRIIGAHLTITYADLWAEMNPSDKGTNVDTLIAGLNSSAYHVTFQLGDDDYDPANPKWWSRDSSYSGKGEAAEFNKDKDIEAERNAVLKEAGEVRFERQ